MPPETSSHATAPGQIDAGRADAHNTRTAPSRWSWARFARFARNACLVAAGVGVAVWAWDGWIEDNLFPRNFGVVAEGAIYRSGRLTPAATRELVERHGIRTVVDLGAFNRHPEREALAQQTAGALGLRRVVFDLEGDATGDPGDYAEALRIMTDPAAQPVLVHCAAGAQRTGCAVALYRHLVEGVDPEAALAEATRYRHDPDDNPHLRDMFFRWKDEIGASLRTGQPLATEAPSP